MPAEQAFFQLRNVRKVYRAAAVETAALDNLSLQIREGEFIEIYDHLAEVHMALGEKDKALEVWKKAVNLETTSGREEKRKAEVEKKLRANQ